MEKDTITLIKENLVPWLETQIPWAQNISMTEIEKPGMGLSNETYLFDLTWEEPGGSVRKPVVLRSAPRHHRVFPDYELSHQFNIMRALKKTAVPVPEMYWMEKSDSVIGSPFYLMERLEGAVPQDYPSYHGSGMFFEASPGERAKMWWGSLEAMAALHGLDWKGMGIDFLGSPKNGADTIEYQLQYWEGYFRWVKDSPDEPHPILEKSLAWLKENRYEPERVSLCWGDARIGNTLYRLPDYEVIGVFDWEMAFLGDPEADLAWFLLLDWQHSVGYGVPRLEGTPEWDESVKRYEKITGWKVKNFFFNEVFAALRFGMILVSVLKKLKRQGIPINEEMLQNNICTQRLSELLGLPSPGKPQEAETTDIKDMTVTVQFNFTGPGGYNWHLVSDRGNVSRRDGSAENPACTVKVTADDWKALQSGELNRLDAWSSGRLVVDGDINIMIMLEEEIARFSG